MDFLDDKSTSELLTEAYLDRPVRADPAHFEAAQQKVTRLRQAIDTVEKYRFAAERQIQRIADTLVESDRLHAEFKQTDNWALFESGMNEHRQHFVDIHFYLTCWVMIMRLMNRVKPDSPAGDSIFEHHKATLEQYKVMRDHLEHVDERLPGKRHESEAWATPEGDVAIYSSTFVSESENVLLFGGQEAGVGPDSLVVLNDICEKWERAIREEALTAIKARA